MSVNAFYGAMTNTQNALGDPRGDARKREQEDMKNAMLQRQMQMREFEFGQQEQEAQRGERERQLLAARAQRDWDARNYGGNRRPAVGASPLPLPMPAAGLQMGAQGQGTAMAPMNVGGAPIEQQAQPQFDERGRQIEQVTVTATPPMATMDQGDYRQRLLKLAIEAGDIPEANRIHSEIQAGMSDQERMGRQQLAAAAGRIIELSTHEQRVKAAQAVMEQYNIDPAESNIDDYFNDPEMLVWALGNVMDGGSLEDALKGNLAVNKFGRQQQLEKQYGPLIEVDGGDKIYLVDGNNKVVDSFVKGISAETRFREGAATGRSNANNRTSIATAGIGATSRVNAAKGAASILAASGKIELVPDDDIPEDKK